MSDLKSRVVVVTGGSRGLGLAIARAFGEAGAKVAITGRSTETLRAASRVLLDCGAQVRGYAADASNEDEMRRLADTVESDLGPATVLVNNAGVNPWRKPAQATSLEEWSAVLDVNLTGVFLGCRIFGERMLANTGGAIINITSVAAHTGLVRTTAYCAAKGGVEAMSRSLAVEWAARGVRVNCVAPAYFETDLTKSLRERKKLSEAVLARTPMGRYGRPEEVAGACVYLASFAASYVTGQTLMVDGGWRAG